MIRDQPNGPGSNIHIFTSHFTSTLLDGGVDAIKSWTANKNINVFEKDMILLPINESDHWTLLSIVNPGNIKFNYHMGDDTKQAL